ncbi:MAG TPA: hypothetical protein VGM30_05290 [Puia sp.]
MGTTSILTLSGIRSDIRAIEEAAALFEEANFSGRAEAMDLIDFHIIDRIDGLLATGEPEGELEFLKRRAEKVKRELERIDGDLFARLREGIRTGLYKGPSFREMVRGYTGYAIEDVSGVENEIGYDDLDVFINGLLFDRGIPEAALQREPEMVFYQKTPARIVFEMAALAGLGPGDVFFDIGSGLGQVVFLVSLISGVPARGIEYEPAYCAYAEAIAARLRLSDVTFINADALNGDYSRGTVFFLYTPFEGRLLQDMLELLETESRKRAIRVFTYGPCSLQVVRQGWLTCTNGAGDNMYKIYAFKS